MSGIEVFGANGTALSLIQMTRNKLGRARRVGRNIGDLRISLGDLLELRPHVDSGKDADLFARIESLVGEATELLEENHGTGPVASMRFLWTNSLDSDVERISHKVSSVYNVLNQRVR